MVDLKNIIKSAQIANEESHDGYPPVEKKRAIALYFSEE